MSYYCRINSLRTVCVLSFEIDAHLDVLPVSETKPGNSIITALNLGKSSFVQPFILDRWLYGGGILSCVRDNILSRLVTTYKPLLNL